MAETTRNRNKLMTAAELKAVSDERIALASALGLPPGLPKG